MKNKNEQIEADVFEEPFPHLVLHNFYNKEELNLIWEELNFYTKPGKLLEAKDFGGIIDATNSKAIMLDQLYKDYSDNTREDIVGSPNYRSLSNILTVNRKLFDSGVLDIFSKIHDCVSLATETTHDVTKVRYYHDGEYYEPHTDKTINYLAFSYFYRKPKKFTGGELIFPKYDYTFDCQDNSTIIFPGWVQHGVNEVKIENSDYYDGYGRYAITSFFSHT
jgi:Rps23 Pro-64 3,4-dihydroxylase Tpa1-like proline 4-hydroxylase